MAFKVYSASNRRPVWKMKAEKAALSGCQHQSAETGLVHFSFHSKILHFQSLNSVSQWWNWFAWPQNTFEAGSNRNMWKHVNSLWRTKVKRHGKTKWGTKCFFPAQQVQSMNNLGSNLKVNLLVISWNDVAGIWAQEARNLAYPLNRLSLKPKFSWCDHHNMITRAFLF